MLLHVGYNVAKVPVRPKTLTWVFTRPFLLVRGWGLETRLKKREGSTQYTKHHTVCWIQVAGYVHHSSPDLLKKGKVLLFVLIPLPEHSGNLQFGETIWTNLRWRAE